MMTFRHLPKAFSFFSCLTIALALGSSQPTTAQKAKSASKTSSSTDTKKSTGSAASTKGGAKGATAKGDWLIKWSNGVVTVPEFEAAYRRMNDKQPYATSLDSLKDFLNVYADYRLKLEDALAEGVDKDPKIQTEIKGYRDMLAGPYILDKELTEPAVHQLWERRQYEINAAHFLAAIKKPNDPADTLEAYNRAMEAIRRLKGGEAMTLVVRSDANAKTLETHDPTIIRDEYRKVGLDSLKKKYSWRGSDDAGSAKNGGDLGWFTGGMTVRPFEDAVFKLNPGEFTQYPVRTRFGYHVIEMYDKRPRIGGVKVSHILVQMPKDEADTTPYYHKADSLLKLLRAGANFEKIAKDNSDDKYSAQRGGDMEYINHEERRAEPSFDQAAYALKDGEISNIVRTSFGYHIIRRNGTVPMKSYEEEKDNLKQMYKRYFYNEDKDKKIAVLKQQYNLRIDSSNVDYFVKHVDSSRTSIDSNWSKNLTSADRAKTIYTLTGVNWTVGALMDSLNAQPGSPLARNTLYDQVTKNAEDRVLDIAARDIGQKYPEFEQIMKDYENGIMLFELENKRVWSQVVPDSAKELAYYKSHQAKFMWPERVDISEIFLRSDSLAKQLYTRIMNGESFDSLAAKYTERPGFKEKAGHWGLLLKDENELSRRAFDFVPEEVKQPFAFQGGVSIVKLNRRDPIHPKTFEEARQEVASQYQDDRASELRTDWVVALRKKYGRQLNEALITQEWKKNHQGNSTGTTGALISPTSAH